ncbi:MAG: hypothetical protein JXB13_12620 [Phycisphaerae bacterium]|nr:hypothetical protein [Phycisphaerae bacterium]
MGQYSGQARNYRGVWRLVVLVGLLQSCWAVGFITRTSFVVEGHRYFCLFDDAMISMRYAANWADGHGFVWNPGERVEGYTNFAWTAVMGLCHLVRLSPSHTCLLVQLLGIAICWVALVATVQLARACRLLPVSAGCAVVLTGTYYNLLFFTLYGMETGLVACLVTFALAEAVKALRCNQGRVASVLWFAPAILVRPDVLPLMLLVVAFLALGISRGRRHVAAGLFVVALVMTAHLLWRHHFYGLWLPNTYYLKATGWPLVHRIVPGIKHAGWTAVSLWFPCFLAGMGLLVQPRRWHLLLLGVFATSVAYQTYVGGDAWPLSRFVIPTTLGLFVLAGYGVHQLMTLFMHDKTRASGTATRIGITALAVIAINAVHWDHCLLIVRPQTAYHNLMSIRYVLAVEKIADSDATVVVGCAGAFPYFSQRVCVDFLGKCEPHIARLPAHANVPRPGHNKFDWRYLLSAYRPDVILHAVRTDEPAFRSGYRPIAVQVDGTEVAFSVRKDSPRIKGGRAVSWCTVDDYLATARRKDSR